MSKTLSFVPTFKDGGASYANMYNLNIFSFEKTAELTYDATLKSQLDLYDRIFLSGPEPMLWSSVNSFLSDYNSKIWMINTSLRCSTPTLADALDRYSNIRLNVFLPGPSMYKNEQTCTWDRLKREASYFNTLNKMACVTYLFYIQNYANAISDIQELNSISDNVGGYLVILPSDISFVESLSSQQRADLVTAANSFLNPFLNKNLSDLLVLSSAVDSDSDLHRIIPDGLGPRQSVQDTTKDCTSCYPLFNSKSTCSSCLLHGNTATWNQTAKDLWKSNVNTFKSLLSI
jgi:hypothetical protein